MKNKINLLKKVSQQNDIMVSISCITYNHEVYIRDAIEGFLSQKTTFPIEILIHDDASTDKTANIIREYELKYPDIIRPIYETENQWSKGIRGSAVFNFPRAKGKYIALCEGDDYWTDPLKLQKQVNILEINPSYAICIHESLDQWEDGHTSLHNKFPTNTLFTTKDLTKSNFISSASCIFRNNLMKKIPDWYAKVPAADWALHFLNSQFGDIYYMKDCMSVYRIHLNGAWSRLPHAEMMLKGIETMMAIDKGTDFKYHKEFLIGIEERFKRCDLKEINKLITDNGTLAEELNKYVGNLLFQEQIFESKFNPKTQTVVKSNNDPFLNPQLTIENMDKYLVRINILNALKAVLPGLSGTLIDLGCGEMPYKHFILSNSKVDKYIGLDIENPIYQKNNQPDMFWDGKIIPMNKNSVDILMATELFEHLPDIQSVLNEINRVLKPGGLLFFTVPFLWPLHDVPFDEYRYTPFALKRHLKKAGLNSIKIEPFGGWNASLAQMLGLWLKRSELQHEESKHLSELFFPFYKQLLETDVIPGDYKKGPMIPGFKGTAKKSATIKNNEEITAHNVSKIDIEGKSKTIIVVYFFPKLSETFILDQIIGLTKQGVDIEIWAQAIPEDNLVNKDVIKYSLLSKVKYVQFPSSQLNGREWKEEFLLLNKVDIQENDLFHVHFGQNFVAFQKLFLEINNPVIVSFHGLDASEYIRKMGKDCYNVLFTRVDLITTPSYEMQNVLLSIGCNKEKMIVHRYGVNTNKFVPQEKFDQKGITILTVARLVEKKGIEYSIKAFAEINSDNAVYKIIGEGPLENELKKMVAQLGINNKVLFLGPMSNDEIVNEMKNTDIYILTSITASNGDKEGLPVTLIEAQSTGIPVVSTIHAGIPELIIDNQTGFLCKEKDIKCISDKLNILINKPDIRRKFSKQAREKVTEEFDIEKLNSALLLAYQSTYKKFIQNIEVIEFSN
jgi:glycosyltransferase involved in cell wall biosynthesis